MGTRGNPGMSECDVPITILNGDFLLTVEFKLLHRGHPGGRYDPPEPPEYDWAIVSLIHDPRVEVTAAIKSKGGVAPFLTHRTPDPLELPKWLRGIIIDDYYDEIMEAIHDAELNS
jgi:hypothetical protein